MELKGKLKSVVDISFLVIDYDHLLSLIYIFDNMFFPISVNDWCVHSSFRKEKSKIMYLFSYNIKNMFIYKKINVFLKLSFVLHSLVLPAISFLVIAPLRTGHYQLLIVEHHLKTKQSYTYH